MGSQHHDQTCARCGIVARMHGPGLAGCERFKAAATTREAARATEAARAHSERRERAYKQLRRAVANWHLQEARELIEELQAEHG